MIIGWKNIAPRLQRNLTEAERLGFSLNSDPRFAYLWLRDWHLYGRVPGWQTQPLLRLVPCVDASDGGQAAPNQVLRANLT